MVAGIGVHRVGAPGFSTRSVQTRPLPLLSAEIGWKTAIGSGKSRSYVPDWQI
jgi:hypothetical protein